MASHQKKKEEKDFEYTDIVNWYETIKKRLEDMRKVIHITTIDGRDDAFIGTMPIIEDDEFLLEQLDQKEDYLSELEKMSKSRRQEWLSVRFLLKEILKEEKKILYTPAGKPYLQDDSYHISISHTKGHVAIIADKRNKVAIDIEYISDRVERIQDRFLSEKEKQSLSPTQPFLHLLLHWSAKECLFKLLDEENITFGEQLHIEPFIPQTNLEAWFYAFETRTERKERYIVHYQVSSDYVLTYIVESYKF